MIATRSLSKAAGVVVSSIDLGQPLTPEDRAQLNDLLNQHGLLVLKQQSLSKQQLVAASYNFGELEIHPHTNSIDREVPEILVISTRGRDGDVIPESDEEVVGRIEWHTDLAYMTVPNHAALLYGIEVPPEGGMTGFIDRQKTYATLPQEMKKRIEGLTVNQSWRYAQESIAKSPGFRSDEGAKMLALDRFPDLGYPLVYAHPVTGTKVLNVPPMWAAAIVEMPGAEGRALLDELITHSLQDEFIYWHAYEPGDLVIWDNWRMMHAASGTKGRYRRLMYRTTIKGHIEFGQPLDLEHARLAAERVAAIAAAK